MPAGVSMKLLAARVRRLQGWRRRGAAFAAGAASVFAMPPCFAWPVLWVTLPVLVWLIDGASLNGEASAPPSLIPSPGVRSDPDPRAEARRAALEPQHWHEPPSIAAAEIRSG